MKLRVRGNFSVVIKIDDAKNVARGLPRPKVVPQLSDTARKLLNREKNR